MFIKPLGFFISRLNDNGAESNKPERGNDRKKSIVQKRSAYLGDFYQLPINAKKCYRNFINRVSPFDFKRAQ